MAKRTTICCVDECGQECAGEILVKLRYLKKDGHRNSQNAKVINHSYLCHDHLMSVYDSLEEVLYGPDSK